MTRDELEFSISQYLDGTLAAAERDALDERLATDGEARALLAEYESLQGVLATAAPPEVDWDRFAARVSGAVAQAEPPAQSYRIGAWFRPARLAVAASVLVAAGLAFGIFRNGGGGDVANIPSGGGTTIAQQAPISIKLVEPGAAAPEAPTAVAARPAEAAPIRIAIGPPTGEAAPVVLRYADGVVQRPAKALIASAAPAAQDYPSMPF